VSPSYAVRTRNDVALAFCILLALSLLAAFVPAAHREASASQRRGPSPLLAPATALDIADPPLSASGVGSAAGDEGGPQSSPSPPAQSMAGAAGRGELDLEASAAVTVDAHASA